MLTEPRTLTCERQVLCLISWVSYGVIILSWWERNGHKIHWRINFQLILVIDGWSISCKIVLKWMPVDPTGVKSTLVQVMAWCRQATSHYLSQCWPRSLSPYGIIWPQWVNWLGPIQRDIAYCIRADSRFAPSQWETASLFNDISHWLGANLESALSLQWWKMKDQGPDSI